MSSILERLTFVPVLNRNGDQFGPPIPAMFNPNSYTISKSVTWSAAGAGGKPSTSNRKLNAPPITFGGGGSRQLSLELFYDTTEEGEMGPDGPVFKDVRDYTDDLVALTLINRELKRPLAVQVHWGGPGEKIKQDFPFLGVISNLVQKFSLFAPDGTPVRANLTVALTEFLERRKDQRKSDPEFTIRVVKRGDTVTSIAAEQYQDPTMWRIIAEANALDDPRSLEIGRTLVIPKVS